MTTHERSDPPGALHAVEMRVPCVLAQCGRVGVSVPDQPVTDAEQLPLAKDGRAVDERAVGSEDRHVADHDRAEPAQTPVHDQTRPLDVQAAGRKEVDGMLRDVVIASPPEV
jgi:hypothetical protein